MNDMHGSHWIVYLASMDVTHCDEEMVRKARACMRDKTAPWRMRAMSRLVLWVFSARLALGLSKRGKSRLRFRAWGRWCGPNYGSGRPVDALDAACREHDNCYSDAG